MLVGVDRTDLVLDAYLVLVAALLALAAGRVTAQAFPRPRGVVPATLALRPRRTARPDSLRTIEDIVALAQADVYDLHFQLRPLLQEIAGDGLATAFGVELEDEPARAEALLSSETWSLLRPDRLRPEGPHVRGISTAELDATVSELDRLLPCMIAVAEVKGHCDRILDAVEQAVVGKRQALELVLLGVLADGHVLIEDVPGLAKTLLARSFAAVTDLRFARIQFTPDLMPSDVTGSSIYNQRTSEFEFWPGPVFANLLLGDEINRAPPKTQAALLEAMQERQVTLEGETRQLERPFLVLATQNPIEYEGTYPLPEAQLDRFLLRIGIGYPAQDGRMGDARAPAFTPDGRRRARAGRRPSDRARPPACCRGGACVGEHRPVHGRRRRRHACELAPPGRR